ncbi:85/88 kDa calcium-independent phospholipase A2 [Holothuria leucospilota]|uniref:phospholipase A2 n=1 Tax=Holothuria leucospilota TaxID=206669 RepID=A0A9Q1C478_HOLLE|nr:85/88 kDa calcium-independent phospholipase A2 [Holothuria leucospilota]
MELVLKEWTASKFSIFEHRLFGYTQGLLRKIFLYFLVHISRIFNFLYGLFTIHEVVTNVRDKLDPLVTSFLDDEYELNVRRKHGDTLIHTAVRQEHLDWLIELLLSGGDLEVPDVDGNSPLHTATQLNNIDLVNALVSFNADVNVKNKNGETPRHLAAKQGEQAADVIRALHHVGAKRCDVIMADCKDGCSHDGQFNGSDLVSPCNISDDMYHVYDPFLESTIESLKRRAKNTPLSKGQSRHAETVLCLDGGGIRALVMILILEAIERASDRRIVDSFDWIAGTSAGSVLGSALVHGYSLLGCRRVFFDFKDELFHGQPPFDGERFFGLSRRLTHGKDLKMKELKYKKPKLLIATTLANRSPPSLHFFRNFDPPVTSSTRIVSQAGNFTNAPLADPTDEMVCKCIRASCSAPTYFTPFENFLDGGIFCNNPTNDAITEIVEYNMSLELKGETPPPLGAVISVGSGSGPIRAVEDISFVYPKSISDIFRALQKLTAAANVGDVIVQTQMTDSRFRPVDRSRAWCHSMGTAFFRLSPVLSRDYELSMIDNREIVKMLWETQVYLYQNKDKFDTIGLLLNNI